jgi:L-amino acid N-acyltransferase YncA
MRYRFEKLSDKHRKPVIDIFNYYVENSFAAYPLSKISYDFFDIFIQMSKGYPAVAVKADKGEIVGFAFLKAYHPLSTFKKTVEITYFLLPEHTRKGIGEAILKHFTKEVRKLGVDSKLANISSLNQQSIDFHLKNGFKECGRFRSIGKKFDKDFDIVWMQRII